MKLRLIGHDRRYAVEQLHLALFPGDKLEYTQGVFSGDGVVSTLSAGRVWLTASTRITRNGVTHHGSARLRRENAGESGLRRIIRESCYRAALPFLEQPPSWGSLAGVRPTKLVTRHLLAGGDRNSADAMLRDVYHVSAPRRRLCLDAGEASVEAWQRQRAGDVSLYVGIPFCPTRCVYCSFVSAAIQQSRQLMEPYLEALEREIAAAAEGLQKNPRRIRTVYIGGGTPTTLDGLQLCRLLGSLHRHFDLSECLELTVEAGRPDTLDYEKLKTLKDCGATRISINPQTMDDRVLALLGRCHSSADVLRACDEALRAGHEDINMDLIAGLPGDSPDGFRRTLEQVLSLSPASVTVHTLALKRSAALYYEKRAALPSAPEVETMLSFGNEALRARGYRSYYLYRQKYMTGSFENVGWCRHGFENLYNIYMMEETHPILSLGAGGVTKQVGDGRVSRLKNPKYPLEYLRDIDAICAKKREVSL